MPKSPQKPTGVIGYTILSESGADFQQIDFPKTKEEIEKFIAESFVRDNNALPLQTLQITECTQNPQNDFDFMIETSEGQKFLELMEIAPLKKKSYDKAPSDYNPYDFANDIWEKIKDKRYGDSSDICLLLYITNWTFKPDTIVIELLKYFSMHKSHSFQYIFYYALWEATLGTPYLIHPTPQDYLQNFNPESYRKDIVCNLSPLPSESEFSST